MNTIAIDCGASFIKGALISENGDIIKINYLNSPKIHSGLDFKNKSQINTIIKSVKEILFELSNEKTEYKLCISNEMHGFILANKLGEPVIDYISWQKEYGSIKINDFSAVEIISKEIKEEDLIYTGMPLRNGLPSCNLLYIINQLGNTEKLYFYTLGDYIIKCLSGLEPYCHPTNAAATGMYDLRTGDWNNNLINLCAGDNIVFPKIGESVFAFSLNRSKYIVFPALGDQQAALLGCGFDSANYLSFNLGTGAQVSMLTKEIRRKENYQIRPYFYGYYLKTIPHIPSGRVINVFIRFIKDIFHSFDTEIDEAAIWNRILILYHKYDSLDMKCDLSFFDNSVTYHNKGALYNIGEYDLTLEKLFYVVFSQMADNFYNISLIINNSETEIKKILFSGGIARKIKPIRCGILERLNYYGDYSICENETLLGLFRYGML